MDKIQLEKCPGCKSRLWGTVKYCPFCGKNVEEISPPPPPRPKYGPIIKGLSISAPGESGAVEVTAVAHSEDGLNIAGAEWWIGDDPSPGNGNPMKAVDGSFKSSRVDITASVDISEFEPGNYPINVRSADVRGVWGSPQTTTFTVPTREEPKSEDDKEISGETEVGDTGGPPSPESPPPPPPSDSHLLRNVFVCVLIAACLFIGYKIISKSKEKAQLSVSTSPSGASLTIDGQNKGRTPTVGISVYPGTHHIVLEKNGYSSAERNISVRLGEKKLLMVTLSRKTPLVPGDADRKRKVEELISKGKASEKMGNYLEALPLYQAGKEAYPDFPGIDELIAGLQNKLKEQERNSQAAGPREKADELKSRGERSENAGNYAEALQLYGEARGVYPAIPEIDALISRVEKKIADQEVASRRRALEGDINRALRNKGLRDVHIWVNRDLIGSLRGSVDKAEDKTIAFDIARSYKDLKEVRDNIQVKSPLPPQIDSAKLEGEINRALRGAGIRGVTAVVSDEFDVTLRGSVTTDKQKDEAFEIARNFKGVKRVRDNIFIVDVK